jgi:hypothetical protein
LKNGGPASLIGAGRNPSTQICALVRLGSHGDAAIRKRHEPDAQTLFRVVPHGELLFGIDRLIDLES